MKKVRLLISLTVLLAGCTTTSSPIPEGYTGPLATTKDLVGEKIEVKGPAWQWDDQDIKIKQRKIRKPNFFERYFGYFVPNPKGSEFYFGHIEAYCNTGNCDDIKGTLHLIDKKCKEIGKPCEPAEAVMEAVFGTTFYNALPDFIVYFELTGDNAFQKHQPVLLWQRQNTPYLYGVRDIYAIVFSEQKVCVDAFLSTHLKNEPNPFSALFSLIGGKSGTDAQKDEDKHVPAKFTWYPLNGKPKSPLWMGLARLSVDANTTNRITVQWKQLKSQEPTPQSRPGQSQSSATGETSKPPTKAPASKPGGDGAETTPEECLGPKDGTKPAVYTGNFLAANGFFSNSPDSYAGVALALGATMNTRDTSVASGGSNMSMNGYALAKLYVPSLGPRLNVPPYSTLHRPSLAVFVGTNLKNNVFDEVVYGLSVGHIIANVGVVVGYNSLAGKKDSQQGRQRRPFVGLEYSF